MTQARAAQLLLKRSVVVCAYTMDRWNLLSEAMDSAAAQLLDTDELVLVIDHNEALLARASSAFSPFATVAANRHERGLSGARNTGVELAGGEIVVFLDDDAAADSGWIETLTAPFAGAQVMGVGGASFPSWVDGEGPWWMPEEFYWVIGCSYRGLPTTQAPVRNPIGCNMAFRTEPMRDVGGFSASLGRVDQRPVGGEETDIAIRITERTGGTILYEPSATVRHAVEEPRTRWNYFVRRCYAEGTSKAILAARVGAERATAAERAYAATLARGVASRIVESVRRRSLAPLGQIGVLIAGTFVTGAGFVVGNLRRRFGGRP